MIVMPICNHSSVCKFTNIISSSASHSFSDEFITVEATPFLASISFSSAAIDAASLH